MAGQYLNTLSHILQPVAKHHKISSRHDGDTKNGHIDDQHDQGRIQITAAFSSGDFAPKLPQSTLTDVTGIPGGTLLALCHGSGVFTVAHGMKQDLLL